MPTIFLKLDSENSEMWNLVKSFAEIKVDCFHSIPLVHQSSYLSKEEIKFALHDLFLTDWLLAILELSSKVLTYGQLYYML